MATTKWIADPAHSEVQFKVKHLMITTVTGSITNYNLEAETTEDNFASAKVNFSAELDSITTGNADRDNHLKSADFFDAGNHPKITFVADNYTSGSDKLTGELTIRGISKPVELDVEFGGIVKDPWNNTKAGFTVTGKISRKDFGLTWNGVTEAGGVVVSDEVRIICEIQLVKQA